MAGFQLATGLCEVRPEPSNLASRPCLIDEMEVTSRVAKGVKASHVNASQGAINRPVQHIQG